MKKTRFLQVLKIVLQMLLAIVTSLGTTLGYNSAIESSSSSSDTVSADCTTARTYVIGARHTDLGADSIPLYQAA